MQKVYTALLQNLKSLHNPKKAHDLSWFFKTGKGDYGEGDQFVGIVVPQIRNLVKIYWDTLTLSQIEKLLHSPIHEYRLFALLVLVKLYPKNPKEIFQFYLDNTKYTNNWDLVDLSCRDIVGRYCYETKNSSILYKLAVSPNLWEKRISVVSTFYFIKNNQFADSIKLSTILLSDPHDLIHKAVGWVLREVGKKDQKILTDFLDKNFSKMSRTTLRYSIERFPENLRQYYLTLK